MVSFLHSYFEFKLALEAVKIVELPSLLYILHLKAGGFSTVLVIEILRYFRIQTNPPIENIVVLI